MNLNLKHNSILTYIYIYIYLTDILKINKSSTNSSTNLLLNYYLKKILFL